MKTYITLFFILTINYSSFSQKLKLSDLKYIFQHNTESVNYYLTKKGFHFYLRKENEMFTTTIYNGENQSRVIKYDDLCKYNFYDSKIYTSILNECKKNGFKWVKEDKETPEGDGITFIYAKNGRCIYFSSINTSNKTKYIITYCIPFPGIQYQFHSFDQ